MSRCKCMQRCNCQCRNVNNDNNNNNNNNNDNNNNRCRGCGCGCGGGCGGGCNPQCCCNDNFCILKSYLEEVQGWEDVVKPCSNYRHHHHHHHDHDHGHHHHDHRQFDMNEVLNDLLNNPELAEELKKIPELLENLDLTEILGNLLGEAVENPEDLLETVFD